MSFFLPDWAVIVLTLTSICVFIAGRVRLAGLLAMPALMRFVAGPAIVALLQGLPVFVIVIAGLLALPVVVVRAGRKLIILFVGTEAADHAIGRALGQGIIHLFRHSPPPE